MHKRPWLYALAGLCFGVLDWFYLDWLPSLGRSPALNDWLMAAPGIVRILAVLAPVALNYGIWLVPVIPVAIFEMKRSASIRRSALAAVIVWVAAMLGYYSFYALLLLFAGLPQLEFMLYSNRFTPGYWTNPWPLFRNLILNQVLMWAAIAVVCGGIVGAATGWVVRKGLRRRNINDVRATS